MTTSHGIPKQQFLTRIRTALGKSAADPAHPPEPPVVDENLARLTYASEDLPTLFAERAEKVGVSVRRCTSADLLDTLSAVLEAEQVKTATLAEGQLPEGPALASSLRSLGYELRDWHNDPTMTGHYDVDAGISGCGAALAETGTIIYRSGEGGGRGHMLVPPLHVVVIRRSDILPDMLDYMARQKDQTGDQLPAAQTFITGPSKTADIEGVLITGVHGPGRVAVVLVEDA